MQGGNNGEWSIRRVDIVVMFFSFRSLLSSQMWGDCVFMYSLLFFSPILFKKVVPFEETKA
jgi:hypothetical protein